MRDLKSTEALENLYAASVSEPSDIYRHTPLLRAMASQVTHATEMGVRTGVSTAAILAGLPPSGVMVGIDNYRDPAVDRLESVAGDAFRFRSADTLVCDIDPTEMLFIDTFHTETQLYAELVRHSPMVSRWVAMHDTEVFGSVGEDGSGGLMPALDRFLAGNADWRILLHRDYNNGFTVIERIEKVDAKGEKPSLAIVMPVWLRSESPRLLEMTLDNVGRIRCTEADVSVVVVANRMDGYGRDWLECRLRERTRLSVTVLDNSGGSVASAWNTGIRYARDESANTCDFLCIMANDISVLPNTLDELVTFGMSRPEIDLWSGQDTGHPDEAGEPEGPDYSMAMMRPALIDAVGDFDEQFWPAYHEDVDHCYRLWLAGFETRRVKTANFRHEKSSTIKADSEARRAVDEWAESSRRYFREKWGDDLPVFSRNHCVEKYGRSRITPGGD